MPIRVDFTDVDGGFDLLEKGVYDAVVYNVEVRDSRAGKPYINWEFKITGPTGEGRRQWYTTSLQSQALWKLKQLLIRLGAKEKDLAGVVDLDLEQYIGRKCRIVIDHEQYQGEVRNRVVDVLAPSKEQQTETLFR